MLLPRADRAVLVDLDLEHPSPEHPHHIAVTGPPLCHTDATVALVNQALRRTGEPATRALKALRATIATNLLTGHDTIELAVRAHLREAIEQLGRARRWSVQLRDQALNAAVSGTEDQMHPANLLRDGSWPAPACRRICPHGGCLVGELTREPAASMAADPLLDPARVFPPEGRARFHGRLNSETNRLVRAHPANTRLASVYDAADPGDLGDLVRRCLVARTYQDYPELVDQLLDDL
jgi:hypothetical protein